MSNIREDLGYTPAEKPTRIKRERFDEIRRSVWGEDLFSDIDESFFDKVDNESSNLN